MPSVPPLHRSGRIRADNLTGAGRFLPHAFLARNAQRAAGVVQRVLAQALALQRQGHIADAERLYASVLAIAPDDSDALHSMGNLKFARGEPGETLRLIGAAMAARAPTPRMLFDLGLAFNALNQHQKALDSFDLAIQLKPDFFEAHGNRGAMLAALGRHDDAIESYRKALAIRPDFADAHRNLGSALTQLQRYEEALASLDRALALRADYPDALYNRGGVIARVRLALRESA